MYKLFSCFVICIAFFVSINVAAFVSTTTVAAARAADTNKDATTSQAGSSADKQATTASDSTAATKSKATDYNDYINSLDLPQNTKNILSDYATTTEGQVMLNKLMNPSLIGPTGSSISTPTAFAMDWGMIGAGVGYANRWPGTDERDGLANFAFGLGDAEKYVGLTTSVLIDSIDPRDGGFADNGTVAFQLFHIFPQDYALAVGVANIVPWGVFRDEAKSYYVVGSKVFGVKISNYSMPLTVSAGAGTGAYYSISDFQNEHDRNIKPFGSVGWRVIPQASIIGEWVARQSNVGISVVPIPKWPIVINAAYNNITHNENQNSFFTVSLAVGYSFV